MASARYEEIVQHIFQSFKYYLFFVKLFQLKIHFKHPQILNNCNLNVIEISCQITVFLLCWNLIQLKSVNKKFKKLFIELFLVPPMEYIFVDHTCNEYSNTTKLPRFETWKLLGLKTIPSFNSCSCLAVAYSQNAEFRLVWNWTSCNQSQYVACTYNKSRLDNHY